jgi:hypothetical protein
VVSEVSSAINPKLSALNQTLALRFIQASVDQTKSDPVMSSVFLSRVYVRADKYLSRYFHSRFFSFKEQYPVRILVLILLTTENTITNPESAGQQYGN